MIDGIGLAILGLYVLMGARRGALASAMRIACPLLAYGAAFFGASLAGPLISRWFDLPRLLGLALAGAICFVLGLIGAGIAVWIIQRRLGDRRGSWPRGGLDRIGGGLVGVAHGAVILLLLGVLVSFLDALRISGAAEWLHSMPETDASRLVAVSQATVEMGVPAALGESGPSTRLAAEFLAHPAATVERVQKVLRHPRVESLQQDRLFWAFVQHSAVDKAVNQTSFLSIAYDESLRTDLAGVTRHAPAPAPPRVPRSHQSRPHRHPLASKPAPLADHPLFGRRRSPASVRCCSSRPGFSPLTPVPICEAT